MNISQLAQDTTNPQGRDLSKNHAGPMGFMDDIKEELIAFVTDWRYRGIPVTHFALVHKIGSLKPEFLEKSTAARLMCVSRFLVMNNLVHRVGTHRAQCPPDEVHTDAKSHLVLDVPKCVGQLTTQGSYSTWTRPTLSLVVAGAPSTCAWVPTTANTALLH